MEPLRDRSGETAHARACIHGLGSASMEPLRDRSGEAGARVLASLEETPLQWSRCVIAAERASDLGFDAEPGGFNGAAA